MNVIKSVLGLKTIMSDFRNLMMGLALLSCPQLALASVSISSFTANLPFDSSSNRYILEALSDNFVVEWRSDAEYCYLSREAESNSRRRSATGQISIARDFTETEPSLSLVCANGDSSGPGDVDPDNSDSNTMSFVLRENLEQAEALAINEFSSTLSFDEESGTYLLDNLTTDVQLQWSSNASYCYLFRNQEVSTTQRTASADFTVRRDFEISNPSMTLKCGNEASDSSENLRDEDSVSAVLNFTVLDVGDSLTQVPVDPNTRVITPVAEVPMGASAGLNGRQAYYETGTTTQRVTVNGVEVEYTTNVLDVGLDVDSVINRTEDSDTFNVTMTQLGTGTTTISRFEFLIVGELQAGADDISFVAQNAQLVVASEDPIALRNNLNGTWSLTVSLDQINSLPVTAAAPLQESFVITGIATENLTYIKTYDAQDFVYERVRPGADLTDYFNDNTIGEVVFISVLPTLDSATRAIIQYDGTRPALTRMTKLYSDTLYSGDVSISLNGELVSTTVAEPHPGRDGIYSYNLAAGILLTGFPQSVLISEPEGQLFNIVGYESTDQVTAEVTDYFQ